MDTWGQQIMLTLFASDIHIGEHRRIADTESALKFLFDTIVQKQPHYTVLLGDIFDKRKPTPKELQVFNKFVSSVKSYSKLIVLEGNHDVDRDISTLTYFKDLSVTGVQVVRPPFIFGRFYLGHEHINGAQVGDGFTLSGGKSLDDIVKKHPTCQVFAFGDFHKPQILRESPLCFYAGSLIKTTFAEKNDTKFLWLFDDITLIEKIEVPGRVMMQYDIKVKEGDTFREPWLDTGADQLIDGALVKVVFSGTKTALLQINEDALRGILSKVKELRIEYNVLDKSKPRNEKINETASNKSVLKEYFSDKDIKYKDEIIKAGEELLNE